jgi:5-methylcytosine-specific restriction endonuclease McrA
MSAVLCPLGRDLSRASHGSVRGTCALVFCQSPLPKGRRTWCSDKCSKVWLRNHYWQWARGAAIHRDKGLCRSCGTKPDSLSFKGTGGYAGAGTDGYEVNHIEPRVGKGYGPGCHHHLSNLETLCHTCHVAVTTAQRRSRKK